MKKIFFILFLMGTLISAGAALAQTEDQNQTEDNGGLFGLFDGDDEQEQERAGETDATEEPMSGQEEEPMADQEEEIKLEDVDQDGDGNVSWGEFQQEADEMVTEDKFYEFDQDGDGVLGSDEFEEAKSFLKEQGDQQQMEQPKAGEQDTELQQDQMEQPMEGEEYEQEDQLQQDQTQQDLGTQQSE